MRGDTRSRLLEVAAEMIAASPGEDVSLRAICAEVGVKMPTLYHFFGSKEGLLDAVIEHGFDLYVNQKTAHESTGDPIQDLRQGWDTHVAFGLANPGFYTLMYGKIRPGYSPAPQARPTAALLSVTQRAADQNRLIVSPEHAAAHVLATNIGVTLRQITLAHSDPELSINAREGVIAAITGAVPANQRPHAEILRTLEHASAHPEILGKPETALLSHWLRLLAEHSPAE